MNLLSTRFSLFEIAVATSSEPTETVTHIWLSAHIGCAAHKLNLLILSAYCVSVTYPDKKEDHAWKKISNGG